MTTAIQKMVMDSYAESIRLWSEMVDGWNERIAYDNVRIRECRETKNENGIEYWINERKDDYKLRNRARRLVRKYQIKLEAMKNTMK